jgi:ArsR family transcriptional regulator, lead/cadmium/zinc/bismuth-responsive transcriptional repressor
MNPCKPESCAAPCPPKPSLEERPLLSPEQALELGTLFKVLANDTRLRLLHALVRQGEMGVMELAEVLAMKPQAVSNQLQLLAARGILGSRRKGINNYYRIVDPCVVSLLDHGLCLSEDAKGG